MICFSLLLRPTTATERCSTPARGAQFHMPAINLLSVPSPARAPPPLAASPRLPLVSLRPLHPPTTPLPSRPGSSRLPTSSAVGTTIDCSGAAAGTWGMILDDCLALQAIINETNWFGPCPYNRCSAMDLTTDPCLWGDAGDRVVTCCSWGAYQMGFCNYRRIRTMCASAPAAAALPHTCRRNS